MEWEAVKSHQLKLNNDSSIAGNRRQSSLAEATGFCDEKTTFETVSPTAQRRPKTD